MFGLGWWDLLVLCIVAALVAAGIAAVIGGSSSGLSQMICPNPNCGYSGAPEKTPRGSIGLGCLLCILLLPVGLVYLIVLSGYRYRCPKCGMQIASDN